ncbi:MAG: EscU/YscU/HrcU family type III secretion system export apparatus switch protein [Spirochaetia bacterium]|nr:EscU/YscU/HrcU family type III secretion system export apparatus switch protein [Spirochaetia bacterium]
MKPTHFNNKAVALSFDPELNLAPVVIAKGDGILAEKIKEIAKNENIEIVNDQGLAELLSGVPAGKEIPESLYKTIAVIYSYLYKANESNK